MQKTYSHFYSFYHCEIIFSNELRIKKGLILKRKEKEKKVIFR